MSHQFTKKTTDHSTESGFSFSFYCDICGKKWVSNMRQFSGGFCSSTESDSALKLLWADEHRAAFHEANLEAHFHFTHCLQCDRWVCDDCFGLDKVCKECEVVPVTVLG